MATIPSTFKRLKNYCNFNVIIIIIIMHSQSLIITSNFFPHKITKIMLIKLTRLQCLHLFILSQASPQVRHISSRIFGGKGAKLTALFVSFLSATAITATLHTGQIELPSEIKTLLIMVSISQFIYRSIHKKYNNKNINFIIYIINITSIKLFFKLYFPIISNL